jgi:phosphoribosyl-ATP pyrophosphohydrolase
MGKFTLADLEKRVHERAKASAAESYTRTLLDKGVAHCAKKLGEEAMLEARGVTLAEVEEVLEKRTAQTGHEEKASRPRS